MILVALSIAESFSMLSPSRYAIRSFIYAVDRVTYCFPLDTFIQQNRWRREFLFVFVVILVGKYFFWIKKCDCLTQKTYGSKRNVLQITFALWISLSFSANSNGGGETNDYWLDISNINFVSQKQQQYFHTIITFISFKSLSLLSSLYFWRTNKCLSHH